VSTLHFPSNDTLCEACGYALQGLSSAGDCPECGRAIAESSPALRTGPDALLKTVADLALRPRLFFRNMRVDGSNASARGFLALATVFIGLGWCVMQVFWIGSSLGTGLIHWTILSASIVLLSYIEAVGVVFFSRKRDWRVPFKLAERLACYASIGWIPAAFVMGWALAHFQDGSIDRWMRQLLGTWGLWQSVELLVLIGAVAMMWFEVLVWTGVRQTKFANYHAKIPDAPSGG